MVSWEAAAWPGIYCEGDFVKLEFEKAFEELTSNAPFPWQSALYERFVSDRPDNIPKSCDLPTGLGKTSVIAIWLIALMNHPGKMPRRLVYVVNRRTVVDQTTTEVEKLRKNLPKCNPKFGELAISTLRGQFADNREWSADPSRPAVICGTVDMIGSRLLFSGYGIGFKTRPLHAGFLGQDALIVHDEAHLEPAFQELLIAIEQEQNSGRFPDRYPLRVMELSATSRGNGDGSEAKPPFTLTTADCEHEVIKQRILATKNLQLIPQTDPKPGNQLAKIAIDHFKNSGQAILIFTRTIDDVKSITDALDKAKLPFDQLIGPMRGLERNRLTDPRDEKGSSIFARFLPPVKADVPKSEQWKVTPALGTVYLVCTSAGEVGVNVSADHLICDLSTFESMAQRLGRVNRFGLRDDTQIHVVHPTEFEEKAPDPQRRKTLALLEQLNGNASPDALSNLGRAARAEAFAPLPTILPTSDILFDAWSMTSIHDRMPGRPSVEPYLHGIRDYEPPETQVAWREEVGVITGELLVEYPPEEMLEAYPLKPHELLGDRTDRVWNELKALAKRQPDKPIWIMDEQGKVEPPLRITELTNWDKKQAESQLGGRTVLLPDDIGGLTEQGMFKGDFPPLAKKEEPPAAIDDDVADNWSDVDGPLRRRKRIKPGDDDKAPAGMKQVYRIGFTDPNDEEDKIIEEWLWFERINQADADARSRRSSYDLDTHLSDGKEAVTRFVLGLSLDADLREAIILAASCHDLGKDRPRWQRVIGNDNYPADKWAKSGKRRGRIERSAYRHEFGSMLDIQNLEKYPAFKALSADSRELVLHLIAAHHGRARPHFTIEECLDENYRDEATTQQSINALRRFARLQRKFGRWGLAYLESLVRAADYAASELADKQPAGGDR
jgi:CRISPR-associated endonuclease/helicase Cas3